MTEQNRYELEEFLEQQSHNTDIALARQEKIRQVLVAKAAESIQKYKAECEEAEPVAREKLETVIQPWWEEFHSQHGLYEQIVESVHRNNQKRWGHDARNVLSVKIGLSRPIPYFWPSHASKDKDFSGNAGIIDEYQQKNDEEQARRQEIWATGQQEYWTANFFFEESERNHGARIGRWSRSGGGYAFALNADSYEIPVGNFTDESLVKKIHPIVFVNFAEQIQSGEVWKTIGKSVKSRTR